MKVIQTSLLFAGACLLLLLVPGQAYYVNDERMYDGKMVPSECGMEFFSQIPMDHMQECVTQFLISGECGNGATANAQCWAGEVVNCAMGKDAEEKATFEGLGHDSRKAKTTKEGCQNPLKTFMDLDKEVVASCTNMCHHCGSMPSNYKMGCWAACIMECSMGGAEAKDKLSNRLL